MAYPTISIVTACYNHQDYIAETIESIISQNYPNLQYVVIDDGSTDNSWKIIQKYKNHLHHCESLKGKRKTPGEALNYAFSKTNGELMGWLNSDDMLLPMSLFTIANIFSDNLQVDWFTGMASTINSKSEIFNSVLRYKSVYDYLIGDWIIIQQESTFYRRSLWKKAGGKIIENKWAFDTELWTRFFPLTTHYHAHTPLGTYRKTDQSQSINDKQTFLKYNQDHLDKFYKKASSKLKTEATVYKLLKNIRPILSSIPGHQLAQIPYLKKYIYKLLIYSGNDNKWALRDVNPFKLTNYPY
jgi:glycosyltransferase involved in cell wall biosynthesis